MVIKPDLADAGIFHDGMARVMKKGSNKYVFIDKKGKVVLSPKFEEVQDFSEGLARVGKENKWQFIDKLGKVAIAGPFSEAQDFSEGVAAVSKNGKWGFIDKTGKETVARTARAASRPPSQPTMASV